MSESRFLDPEETLRLLEDAPDILSDKFQERIDQITAKSCPRCGSTMGTASHPVNPFTGDGRLNLIANCGHCGLTQDPDTGMILGISSG